MRILRILTYEGDARAVVDLLARSSVREGGKKSFHDGCFPTGVTVEEHDRLDITPYRDSARLSPIAELRQALYDAIGGGEEDRGHDSEICRFLTHVERVERELNGLQAFKHSVDEALNTGDGSYKP